MTLRLVADNGNAALTGSDSAAIMAMAERMQSRNAWGPIERVRTDGIDGFYVYNREGYAPIGLIYRARSGEYAVRDQRGACLASGSRIGDVLKPSRVARLAG